MRSESKTRGFALLGVLTLAAFLLAAAPGARAQVMRYLGSITAIDGDTLTVKTDAGDVHQVQVPATASLKRVAPGQTDLTKAEPLEFGSLAVGDRVLVTLDPNVTGSLSQAARIIAIKQADVAKKQEAENAAWNQGVHGLVKSVDATTGVIVVTTRMGSITKDVTVNTTAATVLERYAPGSVVFDQAQPAPITAIHTGDQLSARGTKTTDGTAIAADGVISGTFRSIPGTVISTDTTASTVTVKDPSPSASPPIWSCGGSTTMWRRGLPRGSRAMQPAAAAHTAAGNAPLARAVALDRGAWILKPSSITHHRFSWAPLGRTMR